MRHRADFQNLVATQNELEPIRAEFNLLSGQPPDTPVTSTDIMDDALHDGFDARTQLSETVKRYDNALDDCQITVTALDRTLRAPRIDIAEAQ